MKINIKYFIVIFLSILYLKTGITQTYKLSVSQEDYKSLGDSVIVTRDDYSIDTAYLIQLPFEFTVLDKTNNNIWITSTGSVALGDNFDSEDYIAINAYHIQLQSFLVDPTVSPILYTITGDDGQRIVKVEWKMAYFRALEGLFDNINVQIWIYEENDKIELRYGPSTLELITHQYEVEDSLGHFGAIVGLANNTNVNFEGINLTGDSTAPTITKIIENNLLSNADFRLGFPEDGTVYTLSKVTTNTFSSDNYYPIKVNYFANNKSIVIANESRSNIFNYQLVNHLGQIVNSGSSTTLMKSLNVSNLNSGIYILHIEIGEQNIKNWKFNIQN